VRIIGFPWLYCPAILTSSLTMSYSIIREKKEDPDMQDWGVVNPTTFWVAWNLRSCSVIFISMSLTFFSDQWFTDIVVVVNILSDELLDPLFLVDAPPHLAHLAGETWPARAAPCSVPLQNNRPVKVSPTLQASGSGGVQGAHTRHGKYSHVTVNIHML